MSVTPIPLDLRQRVVERDGTRCLKCGVQTTGAWWLPSGLHLDHIVPEAKGGLTTLANLQVLCRSCNLAKSVHVADYRRGTQASWSDAAVALAFGIIAMFVLFILPALLALLA